MFRLCLLQTQSVYDYCLGFYTLSLMFASKSANCCIFYLAVFFSKLACMTQVNLPVESAFKQRLSGVPVRDLISKSTLPFFISLISSSSNFVLYSHQPFFPFDCVAFIIPIKNNIEIYFHMHRWRRVHLLQ